MKGQNETKVGLNGLLTDESGVGVVEVILILVVLIALVVIFKDQLTNLVNTIFGGIQSGVNSIVE
jgi:Flp pilus assembly pilin Flp